MRSEEPAFSSCADNITALPAVGLTRDGEGGDMFGCVCGPAVTCRPTAKLGWVTLALLCFNRAWQQGRGEGSLSQLPATEERESWQNTQHSFTQLFLENGGS